MRSGRRSAAVQGSVLTTTARAATRPSGVSTCRESIRLTGVLSTTVPSGSRDAIRSGSSCMPLAGTVDLPRANIRIIRSVNRREVVMPCSSSTPEKNGRRMPLTMSVGIPALRHASALLTSDRALIRSVGRAMHRPAYAPVAS